jgi:ubiquitin carboxyl-terminal hydrolase 7
MDVTFAPIKANEGDEFTLTLSRKMTYDQFSKKVAEHLKVEPTHLRFAPVMASTGKAKPFFKRSINQNLSQILNGQYGAYGYTMHRADALYYEILDMALSDYESKKLLKVTWLPDGVTKEVCLESSPTNMYRTMSNIRLGECRGFGFSQRHCFRYSSCSAAKVGAR